MSCSFRVEALLTRNITDYLKTGFWLNLDSYGIYVFYDENPQKLNDLLRAANGILQPLVGNVIYDDKIFWNLNESDRSYLLQNKISVLSESEIKEIWNLTPFDIFKKEIGICKNKLWTSKALVNNYLKSLNLSRFKKTIFAQLPQEIKYQIIVAKLFYKNPEYIHIDFINYHFFDLDQREFYEYLKKEIPKQDCFVFIYTNSSLLQNDTKDRLWINVSDTKYYDACDMAYSIQPKAKHPIVGFVFRWANFWFAIKMVMKCNLKFFGIWLAISIILMSLLGFCSIVDFATQFNLNTNFNVNTLILILGLIVFAILLCLVTIYFKSIYNQYDQHFTYLITKGINRLYLLNSYLLLVFCNLVISFIISVFVNIYILGTVLHMKIDTTNIVWSCLLYLAIFSIGLIPHYLYMIKKYQFNISSLLPL